MSVGLMLAFCLPCGTAKAQLIECVDIQDDSVRLRCYDAIAKRKPSDGNQGATPRSQPPLLDQPMPSRTASELEKRWELRPELEQGTFRLLPYRPVFALIRATSDTNNSPSSPTRSSPASGIDLDRAEAKLQLSFKTKVLQNVVGGPGDLWLAYTQRSFWQAGNREESSLFRETNYQPEAIFIYPLHMEYGGIHFRYLGLSLTHESNGRGKPLTRSWNRLIGDVALESEPWALHLRPWVRTLRSSGDRDDNPDIQDYVGRGELVGVYRAGRQVVSLTGRHTLSGGDKSRGSIRLDWAFPLTGGLNGNLQIFSGYGESLIDYNHRQTTIGLGVSFFD